MEIVVVFARQRLSRDIKTVKVTREARGFFYANGPSYSGFKKHATNFSGIGDERLCAPRFISSGFQEELLQSRLYLFDGNGPVDGR